MRASIAKRRTAWLDLEPAPAVEVRKSAPRSSAFHASLEAVGHAQAVGHVQVVEAVVGGNHKPSKPLPAAGEQGSRRPTLAEQIAGRLTSHFRSMTEKWAESNVSGRRATQAHRSPARSTKPASSGPIASIWSWLRVKCESSATKRLRVTEVASLGEKRFVALVNVGNREFLVGGGTTGVTVLTPLENAQGKTGWLSSDLSVAGDLQ